MSNYNNNIRKQYEESLVKTIVRCYQDIEFTCHSDDIFSVSLSLLDEVNMDAEKDTKTRDRYCFTLSQEDGEMKVVAHYSYQGIWSIGIEPVEGKPIPTWETTFKNGQNSYSPLLKIRVPIDTIITSGDNKLEFADTVMNHLKKLTEKLETMKTEINPDYISSKEFT